LSQGDKAVAWIEGHAAELTALSDRLWDFAEVGLQEIKSGAALAEYLRDQGFQVEQGLAGMPSSVVATWGGGGPVIGFLGELDALPGLSQKPVPVKDPVRPGAPGHGCGHNLLALGGLGAACALKAEMEAKGYPGTVKYYGCPAEETLVGKVFMVKAGLFDGVDIVFDWHPGALNMVRNSSSNAMNSVKFTFHGRTAHAAGDPHNGRSALDGVELMNIGANYLREHIIEKARLHYVITDGGGEPNVVPAHASVWYYVRAPERKQVEEIYGRLLDIAQGAALMTGTTYDVRFLAGCYNVLPNTPLNKLLHEVMTEVGPSKWSDEELAFARKVAESFQPGQKEASLKAMKAPKETYAQTLHESIMPWSDEETVGAGSTDSADVSWVVPSGRFAAATAVIGQPGHSWQYAACSGMSIGHKGMLQAAKVLAKAGLRALLDAELRDAAWADFKQRIGDNPYKSPIPEGIEPPLDQLPKH
jgi:aminobenzoyl-glutamate utilization protein B